MAKEKICIIGAGLTGLTINYLIKKDKALSEKYDITLLEGRSRIGGRIYTLQKENIDHTIEMGATWFGLKHERFHSLLKEMGLEYFEQIIGSKAHYEPLSTSPPYLVDLPSNPEPTLRIKGGTVRVIEKLSEYLQPDQIKYEETVNEIKLTENNALSVTTNANKYTANRVISTLPPYLFKKSIKVIPSLPNDLNDVLEHTHTWMGDSIKIALIFNDPFWRKENSSGTVFSNVGPVPEMYDHSNFTEDFYALKGFLNANYFSLTKSERLNKILNQLQKYFGNKVKSYIAYEETIWRDEPLTFATYRSHILPHQNNGHTIYQKGYLGNKIFIAGTETATQYPGYMEGAVRSAEYVVKNL